jgi:precorrin-2 dehydrogenase/sirohydrochlorin ferrochelatase
MIVDLNLRHKDVLVIGGGTEAIRKVRGLLGQDCKITVISNRLNRYLTSLEKEGKIKIERMKLKDASMLDNYKDIFLILASTDDRILNRSLVEKGHSIGSLVYAVDDPSVSDLSYPSIINIEGIMQIAISTSGRSPIMARKVRIKAERILRRVIKKSDIENTRLQEFARIAARSKIKTVKERKEFLYSLVYDKNIQNLIKEDRVDDAKSATLQLLSRWNKSDNK